MNNKELATRAAQMMAALQPMAKYFYSNTSFELCHRRQLLEATPLAKLLYSALVWCGFSEDVYQKLNTAYVKAYATLVRKQLGREPGQFNASEVLLYVERGHVRGIIAAKRLAYFRRLLDLAPLGLFFLLQRWGHKGTY